MLLKVRHTFQEEVFFISHQFRTLAPVLFTVSRIYITRGKKMNERGVVPVGVWYAAHFLHNRFAFLFCQNN
jgi:hypothetical protein